MRQSADVEEVERRVQEYEQGQLKLLFFKLIFIYLIDLNRALLTQLLFHFILNFLFDLMVAFLSGRTEFTAEEDAHVIGDCVKV